MDNDTTASDQPADDELVNAFGISPALAATPSAVEQHISAQTAGLGLHGAALAAIWLPVAERLAGIGAQLTASMPDTAAWTPKLPNGVASSGAFEAMHLALAASIESEPTVLHMPPSAAQEVRLLRAEVVSLRSDEAARAAVLDAREAAVAVREADSKQRERWQFRVGLVEAAAVVVAAVVSVVLAFVHG